MSRACLTLPIPCMLFATQHLLQAVLHLRWLLVCPSPLRLHGFIMDFPIHEEDVATASDQDQLVDTVPEDPDDPGSTRHPLTTDSHGRPHTARCLHSDGHQGPPSETSVDGSLGTHRRRRTGSDWAVGTETRDWIST